MGLETKEFERAELSHMVENTSTESSVQVEESSRVKSGHGSLSLSDSALLIGYILVFCYYSVHSMTKSYCKYFGINPAFIEIDRTQLLLVLDVLLLAFAFFLFICGFTALVERIFKRTKWTVNMNLWWAVAALWCYYLALATSDWSLSWVLGVFFVLEELVLPLLVRSTRSKASYVSHWSTMAANFPRLGMARQVGVAVYFSALLFVFAGVTMQSAGSATAKTKRSFTEIKNYGGIPEGSSLVVLAKFGDCIHCGVVDSNRTLGLDRIILSMSRLSSSADLREREVTFTDLKVETH
jgi:hypothetical protein